MNAKKIKRIERSTIVMHGSEILTLSHRGYLSSRRNHLAWKPQDSLIIVSMIYKLYVLISIALLIDIYNDCYLLASFLLNFPPSFSCNRISNRRSISSYTFHFVIEGMRNATATTTTTTKPKRVLFLASWLQAVRRQSGSQAVRECEAALRVSRSSSRGTLANCDFI